MSQNPKPLSSDQPDPSAPADRSGPSGAPVALPRSALILMALVAIASRLAFIRINLAEYTDGILQLTLFDKGNPYWPPLYPALAVGLGSALGDRELGGKLVSAIVGSLAVVPIVRIAERLSGAKAALWAGLFFIVLPEGMRWGVRVMTDATFFTLFAASIWLLMPPRPAFGSGVQPPLPLREGRGERRSQADRGLPQSSRLILATLLAIAATLTRYQGILLAAPIAWEILVRLRRRQLAAAPVLVQALWLLIPLWVLRGGFAHLEQILNRTGADRGNSIGQTLLAYLNLAECYFYLFPFSLTPPIFFAFLGGLFAPRAEGAPRGWIVAAFLWSLAFLLAAQAVFGIFEFRYLLPIAAFVLPFAGAGMARLDRALANRRAWSTPLYGLALAIPMLFGMASLILQREAFADLKEATLFAVQAAGPDARIFTNEHYNDKIPVAKTSFWAGREIPEHPGSRQYNALRQWQAGYPGAPPPPELTAPLDYRTGDVLILSDLYGGGARSVEGYLNTLAARHTLERIGEFRSSIFPLLPDLMYVPGAHGSPLWWMFRYQRQHFATTVIRITGAAS